MIRNTLILLLFAAVFFPGCKKDATNPPGVPDVTVNFTVNLDTAFYLNADGYEYVSGGYDGILLVYEDSASYLAVDRGCPYDCETNKKAIITVRAGGYTAICPVCGTIYSLYKNGAVINGPGTFALKQYNVYYNGIYIKITN